MTVSCHCSTLEGFACCATKPQATQITRGLLITGASEPLARGKDSSAVQVMPQKAKYRYHAGVVEVCSCLARIILQARRQ